VDADPRVGVPLALMLHPRDHYDMADLPDELAVWDDLLPVPLGGPNSD
jgi:hypothetical protein